MVSSIQGYRHVFHELTIVDRMVLRGDRIVVPAKLRQRMVEIAHEGHQGLVQTKQLLREVSGKGLPMCLYPLALPANLTHPKHIPSH